MNFLFICLKGISMNPGYLIRRTGNLQQMDGKTTGTTRHTGTDSDTSYIGTI
jgi:hypothetical protein